MSLFQPIIVKNALKTLNQDDVNHAWEKFQRHFHDSDIQANIKQSKEEQYQGEFLIDLFVNIFGYTKNPQPNFNLTTELKNIKGAKKCDGAILKGGKALAVIELKGMDTTDLASIESQAFGYKNNHPTCRYVITSNFQKLRFYIDNAVEFVEFDLFKISREDFNFLYLLLKFDNLLADIPLKIKAESISQEEKVTKQLYKDYSTFKRALFDDLVKNNPQYEPLVLFQKSQKLLDRLLFIFFAEDGGLLAANTARTMLNEWEQAKKLKVPMSLNDKLNSYFGFLNTGYKDDHSEIFAYNGGLFKPDDVLDNVKISDEVLSVHIAKLSDYDFASEVDVNILGHIFENSLTEIDEIKAELNGEVLDKAQSKRKKDGVFYTPKYITSYIVQNTVGKLCADKKTDIGINDEDYITDKKRQKKTQETLLQRLKDYRAWLLDITICDPACGSGAFLNEALNFLMAEHAYLDELESKLFGGGLVFQEVRNHILEHNLFGVDINQESVEIAKLSLWLRTAEPHRKLSNLNENLKCGNSLIDDVSVAGEKAFNWEKEFPEVFKKGGFDVVIGNPPYGAKVEGKDKDFLNKKYNFINSKTNDTYLFFTFAMIEMLKPNGYFGEIIPNTWMLINSAKSFRIQLLDYDLTEVIDYGDGVFEDATVESSTIILCKSKTNQKSIKVKRLKNNEVVSENSADKSYWLDDEYSRILIDIDTSKISLLKKLNINSKPFYQVAEIIWGIKPYQVGHGNPAQTKEMLKARIYHSSQKLSDEWKPLVVGSNVNRYLFDTKNIEYIHYGKNLMYPSNELKINSPKILMRQTSDIIRCVIDYEKFYPQNSLFIVSLIDDNYTLEFMLTLLNSRLINFVYKINNPQKDKTFAEIKPSVIKILPIKNVSIEKQRPFIDKANEMLNLTKELKGINSKFLRTLERKFDLTGPSKNLQNWQNLTYKEFIKELGKKKIKLAFADEADWEEYFLAEQTRAQALQTKISQTDKEIDNMVYQLYGLTNDEIKIIEDS